MRIPETQQLFSYPLTPSIYLRLELFLSIYPSFYLSFSFHLSHSLSFHALLIFSPSLMLGIAILATRTPQSIDIFNKKD